MMINTEFSFHHLATHWKLLATGFILLLSSGYLSGVANVYLAVGASAEAVADHYGGSRLSTQEQSQMDRQGFVEQEFSLDDTPAPMDHSTHGTAPKEQDRHASHGQGKSGEKKDALPPQVLAQVSHVHLLGFSLLLFIVGTLACLTRMRNGLKSFIVILLTLAFFFDIASLNLVRFVSPVFSWLTVTSGIVVGLCFAWICIRVLLELWILRPTVKSR